MVVTGVASTERGHFTGSVHSAARGRKAWKNWPCQKWLPKMGKLLRLRGQHGLQTTCFQRFNQIVKVPRGQASFTLDISIHYDYKVSGGSPPNTVMTPELKAITQRVNQALGTQFNTILMNVYKTGEDCIGKSASEYKYE